jgi:hypothetical protein
MTRRCFGLKVSRERAVVFRVDDFGRQRLSRAAKLAVWHDQIKLSLKSPSGCVSVLFIARRATVY